MAEDPRPQIERVLGAFAGLAIAPTSEASLNSWVRERLAAVGIKYVAEATLRAAPERQLVATTGELGQRKQVVRNAPRIKKGDRIDLLAGRVGIELKVDGGWAEVLRQLDRYAASPDVDALILITSRRRLASGLPAELRGKPLASLSVGAF